MLGAAFGPSLASILETRQEHWTCGIEIIAAGGIADGGSNVQNALEFLFGDENGTNDFEHCQNHMIKGTYELIEGRCKRLKDDLDAITELFVTVAYNATVLQTLKAYHYAHEIASTALYLSNST